MKWPLKEKEEEEVRRPHESTLAAHHQCLSYIYLQPSNYAFSVISVKIQYNFPRSGTNSGLQPYNCPYSFTLPLSNQKHKKH